MPGQDRVQEEAERAAAEAAAIGGSEPRPATGDPEEAERPLAEAGQGEAEGFEKAEEELVEHASHGDQHAARQAIEDAPRTGEDGLAGEGGEADHEHSSEGAEDQR